MNYHSDFMNTIYLFLVDIGARAELGTTKQEKAAYVKRFYDFICTQNAMFPKAKESQVWAAWMSDVLNGKAERKGNNLSAMLICFNNWIRVNRPRFEDQPKQIQSGPSQVGSFTDGDLLNIIRIVEEMGQGTAWLQVKGADSFISRVIAEAERRGLEV